MPFLAEVRILSKVQFKGKLEELGSIEDISITNESSFGGTYVLYRIFPS